MADRAKDCKSPMIDAQASIRLDLLRFPLMVFVAFIHSYGSSVILSGDKFGMDRANFAARFIMNFIANGLGCAAVPLFFFISGYLFFVGFQCSFKGYLAKLQKRFWTLFIPFLFWNVFVLAGLALAQELSATRQLFSGNNLLIADYTFADFISAIFGIGRGPAAHQFWFMRDLMVLVIFSPLIVLAHKLATNLFLSLVCISWFLGPWPAFMPAPDAFAFFYIGASIGLKNGSLFALDKFGRALLLVYLPVLICDVLLYDEGPAILLHKLSIACGVAVALFLSRHAANSPLIRRQLLRLSSVTFFLYAVHEPAISILKRIIYKIIEPQSSLLILALYFLIPFIVILASVATYRFLAKVAPKTLHVITGGRS